MTGHDWDARYRELACEWPEEPCEMVVETAGLIAARRINTPGGARALDLACGTGRNALYLAKAGWSVTAVDFSRVAVEHGKRLAEREGAEVAARIEWVVADARDYEPAPVAYDLVMLCYLHMPWSDFAVVLRRAENAVAEGASAEGSSAEGGTLLVIGHDTTNVTEGSGRPRDRSVTYTPDAVAGVLSIPVEIAERRRRPIDHGDDPSAGTQIDCVVRARRAPGD